MNHVLARIKITLVAAALAVGTAAFLWQRKETARLHQLVRLASSERESLAVRNRALQKIAADKNPGDAEQYRQVELEYTRREVAGLEGLLRQRLAANAPVADPLAENRDPEKAHVRLEHFKNVGQATPSTAFQTLIWSISQGDDHLLPQLLSLSPAGREKLQAFSDKLSPE